MASVAPATWPSAAPPAGGAAAVASVKKECMAICYID